jgi:hypothetical protein
LAACQRFQDHVDKKCRYDDPNNTCLRCLHSGKPCGPKTKTDGSFDPRYESNPRSTPQDESALELQHESAEQVDGLSRWDNLREIIEELVVDLKTMEKVQNLARDAFFAKSPTTELPNSNPAPEKPPTTSTEPDVEWPYYLPVHPFAPQLSSDYYDLDPVAGSSNTNVQAPNHAILGSHAGENSIAQGSIFSPSEYSVIPEAATPSSQVMPTDDEQESIDMERPKSVNIADVSRPSSNSHV